ncbi:MAG: FecR domain-containing protein [Tannerella sp.]|jgi:ferric-dicitrate binding protein FerR (iron transport regulator)|nr:FecR domain-containing protein [Tannerella sp.]
MKRKKYENEIHWLSEKIDEDFELLTESLHPLEDDVPEGKIYTKINRRIRWRNIRTRGLRVAAVLIPLFVLAIFYNYVNNRVPLFNNEEMAEIQAPRGECLQFMFQDGSRVYLEPATILRYPKNFAIGTRKIYLDGAGYFVVEKNAKRPFIVVFPGGRVFVTGTSFELEARRKERKIKLALDDGKVNFKPDDTDEQYVLAPGDRLTYDKIDRLCTITHRHEPCSLSAWKNNIIIFRDTHIAEALKKLERWYDVYFEIGEESVNTYSLTMNVNGSLDGVLHEISKVAPIVFVIKDNKHIRVEMKK